MARIREGKGGGGERTLNNVSQKVHAIASTMKTAVERPAQTSAAK